MKKARLNKLKRSVNSAAESNRGCSMEVYSKLIAAAANIEQAIQAEKKYLARKHSKYVDITELLSTSHQAKG